MANILVFGASIAYGFADSKGGWVQRLRTHLDERCLGSSKKNYFGEIYNLGISGGTTEDLVNRIETDANPRLATITKNTTTLITMGINDSAKWTGKEGNWVPVEKYEENLKESVKKAQKFSKTVILVGITPVDESKTKPIPWAPQFSYLDANIEQYNEMMKVVAKNTGVDFIDLIPELKRIDWNKMLYDGVHPDDEGHRVIFEIIKNGLEERKII